MLRYSWVVLLGSLFLAAVAAPAQAQAQGSDTDYSSACAGLTGADFGGVLDAPTQVMGAHLVPAAGRGPAYCKVDAYITPSVGIEMHLPTHGWNGKFVEYGCGGFCGSLNNAVICDNVNARGYACIVSDMGHKSTAKDGKWAFNNLQGKIDFGYRATHVTALAGRAIATRFYSRAPQRSYFVGCSTGGRQALVSAQRFPNDFDGIVGGAPPISETGDGLALAWTVQTLNPHGKPLFTRQELLAVNKAVVAACDLNDGVRDGLIGDPRNCHFNPASLQCSATHADSCLSAEQVDAISKVYSGPLDSKGHNLYTGGLEPGSEYSWPDFLAGTDGSPSTYDAWMHELLRYMSFMPDPGPTWQLSQFDWDRDSKRLGMTETLYGATNPDLRPFKATGAKFILYQGWLDRMVVPSQAVDYYEAVEREMGGEKATQSFFRLFMVPDMDHCIAGPGADTIDYLSALEAWVERGEAPDKLLAVHAKPDPATPAWLQPLPIAPDQVLFSRPVFPYPLKTVYKKGNPADAASYVSAR